MPTGIVRDVCTAPRYNRRNATAVPEGRVFGFQFLVFSRSKRPRRKLKTENRELSFDNAETATLEFRQRSQASLAFEFVEQSAAGQRARHRREDTRRAPRATRRDTRAPQ